MEQRFCLATKSIHSMFMQRKLKELVTKVVSLAQVQQKIAIATSLPSKQLQLVNTKYTATITKSM